MHICICLFTHLMRYYSYNDNCIANSIYYINFNIKLNLINKIIITDSTDLQNEKWQVFKDFK